MSAQNDLEDAIARELKQHGITGWRFEMGGKHLRVVSEGRPDFVCSASCSDRRAHKNAVADLRKKWGLKRVIRKNPSNRQKAYRKPAKPVARVTKSADPRPDPWAALAPLVESARAEVMPPRSLWVRLASWWTKRKEGTAA